MSSKVEDIKNLRRVLMIFSNSYGGQYARDLSKGFSQEGIKTGFIALSGAEAPSWLLMHTSEDLSKGFKANENIVFNLIKAFIATLRFKPQIIQTHLFYGGIVGLLIGKVLNIPVIHTRHHIDEHFQSGTHFHRILDKLVARNSTHVIVCSQAAKNWLIEIEKLPSDKVTVINQGFDFKKLSPSSEEIAKVKFELRFTNDNINIICVARYSKVKGQEYLLKALIDLVELVPTIRLVFMGPGDSDWLSQMVQDYKLSKYVQILPERNDVIACIAASDFIVHPSLADSFSQLIIEAQAAKGLLIATDIAAAREQIIDGSTGIIIPPRSSIAITEAVLYLLKNPKIAKSIRESCSKHVSEAFTLERMVHEELECLIKYI